MKPSSKRNVYITQFNTPSSRNLMPLAAGLLYSYAVSIPELDEHYRFQIEIMREPPQTVVDKYEEPFVLAFSTYFWNFNQSILVAAAAKERYPNALIIFGGPSAPLHEQDTERFFNEHPYVDAVVAGEGEIVFADLLLALARDRDIGTVEGVSHRTSTGTVVFKKKRDYIRDVAMLPSPFLNGTFDRLLERFGEHMTGAVWETNRGCPFTCTFCFWGGPDSKISQFSSDRVYAELDWMSRNKMSYVFGADANFGILKRDLDIAAYMAKLNIETGYPKYFVINWTKNSTEKIFDIVDVLKGSGIKFMMTTSVQSHNPDTLKAIKRQNIRLESFNRILEEASKRNFDTYSELILGLPLETYESFLRGIRMVLSDNLHYHFNLYQCVLIPGTEMSELGYVKQYGIQTRRCVMNLGKTVHERDTVPEYENIVVGTSTMPVTDWKRSHTIGYLTKAIYGFRPAFFVLNYLKREYKIDPVELIEFIIEQASCRSQYQVISRALRTLDDLQESIISGQGNETVKLIGVAASLHPETAVLITVLADKKRFYGELSRGVEAFLDSKNLFVNQEIYNEVLAYQFAMVPTWNLPNEHALSFNYNIHEYFTERKDLVRDPRTIIIGEETHFRNADEFLAKQIYGGMIFALLKASPLDENQPSVEAVDYLTDRMLEITDCPTVAEIDGLDRERRHVLQ